MRRFFILLISFLLAAAGCAPESPDNQFSATPARPSSIDVDELIARGRAITAHAFGLLSSNLLSAIQQSGVSNALPFCSAMAIPLTRLVADTNEVTLRRVSHRPRNPANRANSRELELIESYRSTLARGDKPQPLLLTNDTTTFYAPIVITNSLCLQCHGKPGQDIAPENLEVIRQLYPNDEATGFGLGDVRGLWRIDFKPVTPSAQPRSALTKPKPAVTHMNRGRTRTSLPRLLVD